MLTFDEAKLISRLERGEAACRTAFAAACATRLLNACPAVNEEVCAALEQAWQSLNHSVNSARLEEMSQELVALFATGGSLSSDVGTIWEDAVSSVAYALRSAVSGKSQEAAWAARRAYEALDQYVIDQEDIDVNLPGQEAAILANPLIQLELQRQERDLDDLMGSTGDTDSAIDLVKQRAARERALPA